MFPLKSLLLALAPVALLGASILSSTPARADALLVFGSGGGMYGDHKMNVAVESFGNLFIATALEKNYRKVYMYQDAGTELDVASWLKKTVADLEPGEKVDVFSMQHSDYTFVPNINRQELEAIVPPGMIRSVYTTACSEWGDVVGNPAERIVKFEPDKGLRKHLEKMQISEYILHANMNATGPLSLPLLAAELRKGGSWLTAGLRAFERMDDLAAKSVDKLMRVGGAVGRIPGLSEIPYASDLGLAVPMFLGSRPVFGGTEFGKHEAEFAGKDLMASEPDLKGEAMLAASPALAKVLTTGGLKLLYDAETASSMREPFGCEGSGCIDKHPELFSGVTATEGLHSAAVLLKDLFRAVSPMQDGCVDPRPFQVFLDMFLKHKNGSSPRLESLCFRQTEKNEFMLVWRLGASPDAPDEAKLNRWAREANEQQQKDAWIVTTPPELRESLSVDLKAITLDRLGYVVLRPARKKIDIRVFGVALNFSGDLGAGPRIPDSLMKIGLRGVSFDEKKGSFSLKVSAALLSAPVSANGSFKNGGEVKSISVFGIPFKLTL